MRDVAYGTRRCESDDASVRLHNPAPFVTFDVCSDFRSLSHSWSGHGISAVPPRRPGELSAAFAPAAAAVSDGHAERIAAGRLSRRCECWCSICGVCGRYALEKMIYTNNTTRPVTHSPRIRANGVNRFSKVQGTARTITLCSERSADRSEAGVRGGWLWGVRLITAAARARGSRSSAAAAGAPAVR